MLKRIYFKLILIGYYLKKSWVYWLVGVSIGFLLYIGRGHLVKIKQLPTFQKQYVGVAGRYTTANLPSEINDLLTYGLTTFTENKKVIASPIVESIYQEDDNHRYIIKLKDNIFWHNGKKLTAADINYNLAGAVIKPEDSLTLMITTPNLFSPLLAALNQPLYKKNLIGLGPNKAIQIDYQGGYLKKLVIQNRDSKIKTVYKFYFSDPDLITAFKLGEVDKIETNLLPTDIEKWNNVNLNQKISPDKKYLAVFLNTEKLNNKSIRQA
ncbi:MAG TPA: hypothetical protein PK131_02730, partial [Candidatus Woesebacteria bacterium]|nr:hypothetical protein [Candidatus Woesebacteria bacterium]